MKIYARIQDGLVAEIIQPAADAEGNEIPIGERFHPFLVATMVDVTGVDPMPDQEWIAIDTDGQWSFSQKTTSAQETASS